MEKPVPADSTSARAPAWTSIVSWILVVAACLTVAATGLSEANRLVVYGPIDEPFHVAYVAHVLATGLPPVIDRDHFYVGRNAHPPSGALVLTAYDGRQELRAGAALLPFERGAMEQSEGIQPPVYYYAMAPVYGIFGSGRGGIMAVRYLTVLLMAAAPLLLALGLRTTLRDRPLAAGVGAVVLGTMSGFNYYNAAVQNATGMQFAAALVIWLAARDWRRRQASMTLMAAAGLGAMTQVLVAPLVFAAAALAIVGWVRTTVRGRVLGLSARIAVLLAPAVLWGAFNVVEYGRPIPADLGSVSTGAVGGTPLRWHDLVPSVVSYIETFYRVVWEAGFLPGGRTDLRPVVVIATVSLLALVLALAMGTVEPQRRPLALWYGGTLFAFASLDAVLLYASWMTLPFYGNSRYMAPAAIMLAGAAGATFGLGERRLPRLHAIAAILLSIVLIRFALQWSTLGMFDARW